MSTRKKLFLDLVVALALCLISISYADAATVKALVVAGGGGGGGHMGGGGGAGGFLSNDALGVAPQAYTITVGGGGGGGDSQSTPGSNGGNSSIGSLLEAIGGGGGGTSVTALYGSSGGSGGGGSYTGRGGDGTAGQGNIGGNGENYVRGGGGGGAGGAGTHANGSSAGNGGGGTASSISGSSVTYAGGGGGGCYAFAAYGSGGAGGGGNGGNEGVAAQVGTANTGGGGGGGNNGSGRGRAGGSGIVIIRYLTADFGNCTGGAKTTDGAYTVHTFSSSGTFTVVAAATPTPTNSPTMTPTGTPTMTHTPTTTPTPTNTPTGTPTQTPTNTPTSTPTMTPTNTPTITPTPDSVPPAAPVIEGFYYDKRGQIKEIRGTAEANAKVYGYDGATELGNAYADGSGNWTYTPGTPIPAGPHSISAKAEDASLNQSPYSDSYGLLPLVGSVNASRDVTETHSGAGSMRIEKAGSCEFRIAVNVAGPATVKAWMRKNIAYTGAQPTITLTGLGMEGTGAATASMTAGSDTWEQVTVTGTPNAKGVVTLRVETFSTAADAKAWVDDLSVSQ